jgi:hypothetical protein
VVAALCHGIFLNLKSVDQGEKLAKIDGKLEGLVNNVNRLLDHDAKATIKSQESTPSDIKNAAVRLHERKIVISPEEIHAAAEPLLTSGTGNRSDNWDALAALVNLRSFVNSSLDYAKQHTVVTVKANSRWSTFQRLRRENGLNSSTPILSSMERLVKEGFSLTVRDNR